MVGGVKRGCLTGKCAVLAYRARTGRAKGLLGATTQGVEPPQPPQRESQSPHRALTGAAMPGSPPPQQRRHLPEAAGRGRCRHHLPLPPLLSQPRACAARGADVGRRGRAGAERPEVSAGPAAGPRGQGRGPRTGTPAPCPAPGAPPAA